MPYSRRWPSRLDPNAPKYAGWARLDTPEWPGTWGEADAISETRLLANKKQDEPVAITAGH